MYIKNINKFEKFLYKERGNSEIIRFATMTFIAISMINIVSIYLFKTFYSVGDIVLSERNFFLEFGVFQFFIYYFVGFFFLALFEEVLFRLPIALFIRRRIKFVFKLILIFFLAVLFSIGHMSEEKGILLPLFVQGTGALLLSFLFIVSGGNKGKYIKAILCVTIIHFLNNITSTILPLLKDLTK